MLSQDMCLPSSGFILVLFWLVWVQCFTQLDARPCSRNTLTFRTTAMRSVTYGAAQSLPGKSGSVAKRDSEKFGRHMGNPGAMTSRNHRVFTDIQALSADPNKVDEHLFSEWSLMDQSRPFSRIFCSMFYVSGLGLLAIPSIRTFFKVLDFVAKAS